MKKFFTGFLVRKRCRHLCNNIVNRALYQINFDTNEEIIENYLGNIMLIGINLPDSKNLLTETAVEKLCTSVENFHTNDEAFVGILHGLGGNFCTGLVQTERAFEKSRELIESLHTAKKPMLASLQGCTLNFGLQLALMCDMRIMEENSLVSFGSLGERLEIPISVYQKLVMTVGLSRAMEMTLMKCTWTAAFAQEVGLANRTVECGTALGQCVNWAQSMKTTFSLKDIITEKSKIVSVSKKV